MTRGKPAWPGLRGSSPGSVAANTQCPCLGGWGGLESEAATSPSPQKWRKGAPAPNSPTKAMTKAKTCSSPCRTLVVRLASFLKTR